MAAEHGGQPVSPFVIRSASVSAMREAAVIRKAAQDEVAQLRMAAAQEAESLRAAGIERGRAEGAAAAAALTAAAEEAIASFWATREAELVDLALAIAHRIVGSMPAEVRLAAIARTALAEHKDETELVLRTSTGTAGLLRAALADCGRSTLAVEEDASLAAEACVLVHRRGRTRLGLLDQFRQLMADQRP